MSGVKTVYLFMFVHLLIVEVIGIENGEKLLVPIRTSNCCGLYTKIYTKNIYSIMIFLGTGTQRTDCLYYALSRKREINRS